MRQSLLVLFLTFSLSVLSQVSSVNLNNFSILNNEPSRVYFESSDIITGSTFNGFKIEGKKILKVTIQSDKTTGHYFTVNTPFTYWDNHLIRYEGRADSNQSDFKDKYGYRLSDFTIKQISNNILEPKNSNYRYVNVKGAGEHDGSLGNEWTLSEAMNNAKSGMTVFIKKGLYPDAKYQPRNNGSINSPIKFIGYNNSPGDNPTLTRTVGMSFKSNVMPLIDGKGGSGWGINVGTNSYLIFKNIQIQGFTSKGSIYANNVRYTVLDNVYLKDGDRGFECNSSDSERIKVLNSYVADVFGVALRIQNKHSIVKNTVVVSSKVIDMDYYIAMYSGNEGHSNSVIDCKVERYALDSHGGHGIDLRTTENGLKLKYSLVENCTIINLGQGVSFRHSGSQYNVARNITSRGNGSSGNLVTFRDDCSYNIIENSSARNTETGIQFRMNQNEDKGQQPGGHHNKVINSTFDGAKILIFDKGIGGIVKPSSYNEFINCTFNGNGNRIYSGEPSSFDNTNKFINCLFNNFSPKIKGNFNPSIEFSNLYKVGTLGDKYLNKNKNISVESKFQDVSKGNFRLKSDSPLIDKGKIIDGLEKDFDGNYRPQGSSNDIGAFEYYDGSTSSIRADAGEDREICLGEDTTLTASGGTSYLWSNGSTNASIKVSPTENTVYSVEVFDAGEKDSDEVMVMVNNVVADAGFDVTIAPGEEVILIANGGDSYLWNNGETNSSIKVKPNKSTTYSVQVSTGNCSDIDEVQVTVKELILPDIVANAGSDQTICSGESITLTATGGKTYLWNNGSTTASISVSPNNTTTYSVDVIDGEAKDTDEVVVNVIQVKADAGTDKIIKKGDAIELTAAGGESYIWSNGETSATISVSPSQTKTYSVIAYKNNCSDSDEVTVKVEEIVSDPQPIEVNAGEDQTICSGESVNLSAEGGDSYNWNTGDTNSDITVNPSQTTTYELKATRSGIDYVDYVTVFVENCQANIDDATSTTEIYIYPNPSNGLVNLESSEVHSDLDIQLINMNGKILIQDKLNSGDGEFSTQLDLSNFTKGIYFVRIFNSFESNVKKIVLI